jgi:hypothetical protein
MHTGAYWLLWSLRSEMPRRSTWRVAHFETLQLRLVTLRRNARLKSNGRPAGSHHFGVMPSPDEYE